MALFTFMTLKMVLMKYIFYELKCGVLLCYGIQVRAALNQLGLNHHVEHEHHSYQLPANLLHIINTTQKPIKELLTRKIFF